MPASKFTHRQLKMMLLSIVEDLSATSVLYNLAKTLLISVDWVTAQITISSSDIRLRQIPLLSAGTKSKTRFQFSMKLLRFLPRLQLWMVKSLPKTYSGVSPSVPVLKLCLMANLDLIGGFLLATTRIIPKNLRSEIRPSEIRHFTDLLVLRNQNCSYAVR